MSNEVVSYKELIGFIWQFMRLQKYTFGLILLIDSFAWSADALLWPLILRIIVDIFTRYEGDRMPS